MCVCVRARVRVRDGNLFKLYVIFDLTETKYFLLNNQKTNIQAEISTTC